MKRATGILLGMVILIILAYLLGPSVITSYITRRGPTFKASATIQNGTYVADVINESWHDLTGWQSYQNKVDKIISPEPGNIVLRENTMRLGISPAADFDTIQSKYNNTYLLSNTKFGPTESTKIIVEFSFSIHPNYQGSSGIWIENSTIFQNGTMTENGFSGAFGLNFLSADSDSSGLSGLTFTYVRGWLPQCTIPLEGIDPSSQNRYRIEWSARGWAGYVNDVFAGTCAINEFSTGEIQLWADNYYLPNTWTLSQLNPASTQHSTYGPIRVWIESTD